MKIVVIGGAGVFGEKLCRLLCRDRHQVWVAGRRMDPVQRLADQIGATPLVLDRAGDLGALSALNVQVVVDAAGPFHSYGDDPYRLVRFCVEHRINYLDLSDNADFCSGISVLDAAARKAGVFALSGTSSVPAISSAVVVALSQDMDQINLIESAILPGNKAPRGRSVIASILHQVGTDISVRQGGAWRALRCWSDPEVYDLARGVTRQGYLIEVPDLRLFPDHFKARTVLFRAGLELGVMRYALVVLSHLRHRLGFRMPNAMIDATTFAARLLYPFGTDQGGMVVHVAGRVGNGAVMREWRLFATHGDGPFVPAIAARAALRDTTKISNGARPCVGDIVLDQIEKALEDLHVTTQIKQPEPLFSQALGAAYATLPAEISATHQTVDCQTLSGCATIIRGRSMLSRLIAWLFRFPAAGNDIPVCVIKTVRRGETWQRQFGNRRFRSHLSLSDRGHVVERFGPLAFEMPLYVRDDALYFPVARGWAFGLPIPKMLLPKSVSREYVKDGVFHFDVQIVTPFGGLIVHYKGWLKSESGGSA